MALARALGVAAGGVPTRGDGAAVLDVGSGTTALAWKGVGKLGVGSNVIQPRPAIHSSGQACASAVVTINRPSTRCPAAKPVTRRAGMPARRASTTMAVAKCVQKPRLDPNRK